MASRIALTVLLALVVTAAPLRAWLEVPGHRSGCVPVGRGEPPSHYLGCATDGGPARVLAAEERLVLGLPIDPNTAGARELAFVPGLSRAVAAEIVADRQRNGAYREIADLLRVRGVGTKRLAAASAHLAISPP